MMQRQHRTLLLGFLHPVHSHIIHKHSLWPGCCVIGTTGPIPTDGDVEKNEIRMIEDPSAASRNIDRASGLVELSIHEESYDGWLPFYCEDMEIVREVAPIRECVNSGKRISCGIAWPMEAAVVP